MMASATHNPLEHLNQITKTPKLDIQFEDLKYSVRDSTTKSGTLQILNEVNGKFRCGELTAILGPSGSGKTTLLNILAGYVIDGVEGDIKVNNHPRDLKIFSKLSSYLMQDDIVQPRLTVREAMMYAADLKLGSHLKHRDKAIVATEVLKFLGLEGCANTFCENLSGGETKRLSIALELVNNPPVIFLDEPTTGLDNVAIKQCVDLLKKITNLDRTVICTIHQPPASLFQVFDQVYILAKGYCVYNGSPSQLVPFFTLAGYSCPPYNTPADYMIELVHSDPSIIESFKSQIQNGKNNVKETEEQNVDFADEEAVYLEFIRTVEENKMNFAVSYHKQLLLLFSRMLLQTVRGRLALLIQIFQHLISSVFIGAVFSQVGNNANPTEMFTLVKFCLLCTIHIIYTYVMTPVLLFPFDVQLLKREHFNHWYSFKAYYSAWTIVNGPPLIILCTVFATLAYFISGQPHESSRFIGFCLILLLVGLTSQGLGFLLGAVLSVKKGAITASAFITALLTLGIHGMGYEATIGPFLTFIISLSFLRNGLIGLCSALYYQREPLKCDEDSFCPFTQGDNMLLKMSVPITDYKYHLAFLLVFMVVFRIAGYFLLKCTLNVGGTDASVGYYFKKLKNVSLWFRKGLTDVSSNNI